jgi:hypothetical protein
VFNGHNYKIFYSEAGNDSCPCTYEQVDGTSCSAPSFAGMITLVNDYLLNNGKSQLGFLNYLLYQVNKRKEFFVIFLKDERRCSECV